MNKTKVKVRDQRTYKDKSKVYGYCSCGREVLKGTHKECPHCGIELDWNEEE